jgi:hypothetical protein
MMSEEVEAFIKHTIVNLEGALKHKDEQLTRAVLINLSDVLDSYIQSYERV